jgi:hypothetical protein
MIHNGAIEFTNSDAYRIVERDGKWYVVGNNEEYEYTTVADAKQKLIELS